MVMKVNFVSTVMICRSLIYLFRNECLSFPLAVSVIMLLLTATCLPSAVGQTGAVKVAKEAAGAVSSNSGNQSAPGSKNPYHDKEPPKSFEGWVDYILNFPLYKTGGEWIRLKQIFLAIAILILGIWLSILVGRIAKGWMVRFKSIPVHIAIAVSKGLVYLLSALMVIGTVLFVGMPFTVVTILGGVVLLGASLGAKSTIYDYMSGVVLALEQPIRIGDCIEVKEYIGFVEEIQGRYTRVRRLDGIDVLVPNSMFLENEVVNWTLHDSRLRGDIKVGVRYDSDVDKTMDILMACITDRKDTLSNPKPSVLLWDFGDSALIFRLFFWLEVNNPLNIWTVESDLRHTIFGRLHASGISIAYPQHDLHLDTKAPISVQLSDARGQSWREETGQQRAAQSAKHQRKERGKHEKQEVAQPERGAKNHNET